MISQIPQTIRLIIASALAALIIMGWKFFYVDPTVEQMQHAQQTVSAPVASKIETLLPRDQVLATTKKRVNFSNNKVQGSINTVGARIDDLVLKQYHTTISKTSSNVALLSPSRSNESYFVEFGWVSTGNSDLILPDVHTEWKVEGAPLAPGSAMTLQHTNAQGITFKINIALDHHYMFSVKQSVVNHSTKEIVLGNYATISRTRAKSLDDNMLIHEGAIGVFEDKLKEYSYEDLDGGNKTAIADANWLGFSDKYWLSALIPSNSTEVMAKFSANTKGEVTRYQASINSKNITSISPGRENHWTPVHVFVGAKELDLLDAYEKNLNIKLFDRAVDFGVLYFITKPIFELLHHMYDLVGNFGFAILLLTVFIKLLLFPLAHKGFKGMNRLKELQPKLMALKEQFGDKPQEFQKAMIELYRKEKVNPMGGCLPILLQIPIFFALYKVLYVTIEMRHAPFIWWIQDLSAPEGISVFNLFGLLPLQLPQFLMIGVFPILMAFTMFIQQKLNPEPTDPVQAQIMKLLPLVFLFMFASFPSGLVVYWTWSNVLSIGQQLLIKHLEKPKRKLL
jgi:YidC/Oxa1 family membrane protein insertase